MNHNKENKKKHDIEKESEQKISSGEFDAVMKKILSAPPKKKKEKPA